MRSKGSEDDANVLRRTHAILEGVGDGVYVTDVAGEIRLWNRSAERLLDCRVSQAMGKCCTDVLGLKISGRPLDCSSGCALLAATAGKPPGSSVEVTRMRRDGREQPLLVNVSPVKGPDGKVSEYVHSLRDITTLKQADEAKTMFLATASHELKTPLTVILGFVEMLIGGWLENGQREEALRSIERRARELSRIVDRLLMTGRIESGRIMLHLQPTCIKEILRERVTALAGATERKIRTEFPDDLPMVLADSEAMMTVIDHLLENAVKYSPDGGEVVVSARPVRSRVEIDIVDQGIGMDIEQAERCFDRFWQAESSDVRRFGGTGIGLYIVQSLVENMQGKVWATSAPGHGSTFTIRLRRAESGDTPPSNGSDGDSRDGSVKAGRRTMIQEFMKQIGVPEEGK